MGRRIEVACRTNLKTVFVSWCSPGSSKEKNVTLTSLPKPFFRGGLRAPAPASGDLRKGASRSPTGEPGWQEG